MHKKTFGAKLINYLKMLFFDGLLAILPIVLTLTFFKFIFKVVKHWLTPISQFEPTFFHKIPQSEFFVALLVVLLAGAIFHHFIIRSIMNYIESIFFRIPLMNSVYSGIKQLVQAFTNPEKMGFKKVVLVEYPRKGIYCIGFLTQEASAFIKPQPEQDYDYIFIPSTPNPTTGFFILVPHQEVTITDLTRQEAMALIISGGIVQPERYLQKKEDNAISV